MNHTFFSCILLISCMTAVPAAAQQTMTVDDAVATAVDNNISIQRNRITVEGYRRADAHSWNSISPSLNLSADYRKPTAPTDPITTDYTTSLGASVSLTFSPSLFTSMKTARLNYEKGLISFEQACRSVELSVRSSFYAILYETENLSLQKRNLETARQQYETNRAKYNAGRIPQLDVLTAQVTYEKLKPAVESAEITLQNDMNTFKQLLGLDLAADLALSGSLDDILALDTVVLDQDIDQLVQNSSSVQLLVKQLQAAETAVTAFRFSAYGPTATASWAYDKSTVHPKNGSAVTTDTGSLKLGVSIPLDGVLPWSSKSDNVTSAKDAVQDLKLQLQDQKTAVKVSIQNYLRQIQQAQSTIKSLQANISLAKQSYEMTQEAYSHGTKDLLSLQTSSDALLQAQVSLKSEAYTLIKAILNLEDITGSAFGTLGK